MLVFISGLVSLMLSLIKIKGKTFRELAFDGMPISVRSSISVGIGLFIAYIGSRMRELYSTTAIRR